MLQDMEHITKAKEKLPLLEAWLQKKQPNPPYTWQKRWVIVKDSHLLWSDKQRVIKNASNPDERKPFNGFLNIVVIQEIKSVDSKSGTKFVVVARTKRGDMRTYEWKAGSQADRNFWVAGLNAHKDHAQMMLNVLQ